MKFKSLGYCFVQGLKNIGRNRIFSLASVVTMSLCIFILGLFYSITRNVSYMVDQMSESLCVKVFFDKGISDERIQSIGNSINKYDGVTMVHFTSADEAWEKYKEEYFGETYMDLADGYAGDNPLKDSASYEVYFSDAGMQEDLVNYIKGVDGVKRVNSSVSLVVLVMLTAIALFLISNTISIGITVRDEEIKIMRLLGAHNAFIRAPFVVEGIIIGIAGALIPIGILYAVYGNIVKYILTKFSFLSNILSFMPVSQLFKVFVPMAVALSVGLGLLGSFLSLNRHLKEK